MDPSEISVEPTLRDVMTALLEIKMTSKALEDRVARMEIAQGKKVVDEEEGYDTREFFSGMDKEDLADYLAKKEKAIMVETSTPMVGMEAVVRRMDKMQELIKKTQGVEDHMLGLDDLCPSSEVKLPEDFKMPKMDPFDGSGNPHHHLRHYAGIMRPLSLSPASITLLFHYSLKGAALKWYLSKEPAQMKDWDTMASEFVRQYNFNLEAEITVQDLEMTKQMPNETFAEFVTRLRGKVALMSSRPTEREQLRLIIKNLQPCYYNNMFAYGSRTFDEMMEVGKQIQEALQSGKISRIDGKPKAIGEGSDNGVRTYPKKQLGEVAAVRGYGPTRNFTPLGISYARMLEKLAKAKLLSPLIPKPPPNPLPSWWATGDYCEFHQGKGHSVENCWRLKHEIEDLFDQGKIPRPSRKPNVNQNPLPRYHAVAPPNVNAADKSLFDA